MRARNMTALANAVTARWPGVTIYGIGDAAHKLRASDHNEDDTAGSKAAQSDKDSNPEYRAIDIMVRGPFTKADADRLVAALLADPAARARIYGIIWNGSQWWRSTGFTRQARTTDPHTDHVHVSGLASDDENAAGWPAVGGGGGELFCAKGATNDQNTKSLQVRLKNVDLYGGAIDGDYGDGTAAALRKACLAINPKTGADGSAFDHNAQWYLDRLEAKRRYAEDNKATMDRMAKLEAALKALGSAPAPAPAPAAGLTLPAVVRIEAVES